MSDEQQQQQQQQERQPVTALQDLIAGGLAGSASVCVGHPFDTHKVMLQTSSHTSALSSTSMNSNMNKLSILKLYKGMGAPLSTAAVVNAMIFSSFGESSRLWDDYFFPEEGRHSINNEKDVPNVSGTINVLAVQKRNTHFTIQKTEYAASNTYT